MRLAFIPPMTPTLIDQPPTRGEWATEVKFDGWRCQLVIDSKGTRVFTRRGRDWTDKLRIVADAAASDLKVKSAIIDGELVYPHESGRSDFRALQAVVRSQSDRLVFMAFDLLYLNDHDMRSRPLGERRARLQALIPADGRIQFSEALEGSPEAVFAAAERLGLEGVVCKRQGSLYHSGTATDWVKVKCFIETDYELLGVQRELGKPTMALMGAVGSREYVGNAFVTFGRPASESLWQMVTANTAPQPPGSAKKQGGVTWLNAGIIGRVRHLKGEDKLRHARLMAFWTG